MTRAYGRLPICPVDGGMLLAHTDWGQNLHCPNARHGGNGMMFAPGEWLEGTPVEFRGPSAQTTAQVAAAAERAAQHRAEAEAARVAARSPRPAKQPGERKARVREPRPCKCECGGLTKGGTFLPGHDARYHARMKREAAG